MNHNVTVSIFLESRTPKKDETFPVKLRVTYNRERKYFGLKMSLSQEQYNRIYSERPRGEDKELKIQFNELESKAYDIIKKMPVFTFELFEKELFGDKISYDQRNVFHAYDNYIKQLKENEQFGSADTYSLSKKSIMEFCGRKKLLFEEITPEFLNRYEKWQRQRNKSSSTIGIYLRDLRTLFNIALANDLIKQSQYPFGRNKYQIPATRNIKKALGKSDISKIFYYEAPKGSTEEFAKDIWLFSYLCNGMNIADIARLKYEDYERSKLIFFREKTKRTAKENLKPIIVYLLSEAVEIIERWGNNRLYSDYIFPIFKDGEVTEYQQRKRVKQFTKTVNKYLKRIGQLLEIELPLTTLAARHSFSTVLKNADTPDNMIKESMGHSSILTTNVYFASFEEETNREFMKNLVGFKNNKKN
jgi:integrase/recombinase XerD